MKIIKLTVLTSSLVFTQLTLATSLTSSTFPLSETTINHQSRGVISLKKLVRGRWNIDCEYKVKGKEPSSSNPLVINIQGSYYGNPNEVSISGRGYTSEGLIAAGGTVKINNVLKDGMVGSVSFDNYDLTADLHVFNCVAWKF